MLLRFSKFVLIIFIIAFFLSACSALRFRKDKDKSEEEVILGKINDEKLTVNEFYDILSKLPERFQRDKRAHVNVLNNYIGFRLVVQDALRRKIDQTPDYKEKLKMAKDELLINEIQSRLLKEARNVSDAEIYRFYLKHINAFTRPRLYHIKVIETKTEFEIQEVVKKIRKGEDFEYIAENYSTHQSSIKGGDLGFIDIEDLPDILERSILLLSPGQVSPVVYFNDSYHIFKLSNVRPERVLQFEEIKPALKSDYIMINAQNIWQLYIENLVRNADIDIDEEIFKNIW